jgi:hypothetical protein
MSHSALLWSNDQCSKERVYTFSHKGDFVDMLKLSIDRSVCYLEQNVFSMQDQDHVYGEKARTFMSAKHELCTTEGLLHKEVKHWQTHGLKAVRWTAFSNTAFHDSLPPCALDVVRGFYFKLKSGRAQSF